MKKLVLISLFFLFSVLVIGIILTENKLSNGLTEDNLTYNGTSFENKSISFNFILNNNSIINNSFMISSKEYGNNQLNVSSRIGQDLGNMFINYTKPVNSIGAIWQVKHGNNSELELNNLSIPESCWSFNADELVLKIVSNGGLDGTSNSSSDAQCYNGTEYESLNFKTSFVSAIGSSAPNFIFRLFDNDYSTCACHRPDQGNQWYNNCYGGAANMAYWYEEEIFWNITNLGFEELVEVSKPNNISIYINETKIFNQSSILIGKNISINITLLNNILDDGCNCKECTTINKGKYLDYYCSINYKIESQGIGAFQISNMNLTYNYTDLLSPYWQNNQTNNSFPKLNDSIEFNIRWVDDVNLSKILFQWNCTALGWNNLTMINATSNNATAQFNQTLNFTSDINSCYWQVLSNDTSNNLNQTDLFLINIQKQKPNITVALTPQPANDTQNITLTITFSDPDSDTWVSNETKWYNGSVELVGLRNLTFVTSGNFSSGEEWTASARVFDTFNFSIWRNDSLTFGDNLIPTLTNESADTSISLATVGFLEATCSDISSSITDVTFTLIDPVGTVTTGSVGTPYEGDKFRKSFAYGTLGNWNYSNVTCADSSGNIAVNSSVNIIINVFTPSVQPGGGGGGGSSVVQECTDDEDCNQFGVDFFCISNSCVKQDREDIAKLNLVVRGLSESIIQQALQYGSNICNYDGNCDQVAGESRFNCGTNSYQDGLETIIIEGDCTGGEIAVDFNFISGAFAIVVVLTGILFFSNRGKKK